MWLAPLALAVALAQVPGTESLKGRIGARWTPEVDVYRSARPSVVRVRLEARLTDLSASIGTFEFSSGERWIGVSGGTGVIYTEDGWLMTNAHVIDTREDIAPEDQRLRVILTDDAADDDGTIEYPASIVAVDRDLDLAVLRIDAPRGFSPLQFAKPDDLLIGEKVIALGAPFGRSVTLSSGILSGLGQEVLIENREGATLRLDDLIQTDAAINEGFSGGPLLNAYGELIGLTVSRVDGADGIAYAIPTSQILASLQQSLLGGAAASGSWTGMDVGAGASLPFAVVQSVHPRGPAAKAGLRGGDRILSLDNRPVPSLKTWAEELSKAEANQTIKIQARRDGRSFSTSLTLAPPEDRDSVGLVGARFGRGVYLPPQAGENGSPGLELECPRVEEVIPGSPADRLGLEPGDLVLMLGVDDRRYPAGWAKVRSASELISLMRGPTFRLFEDNIWIARGSATFVGTLPVDDPQVLARSLRNQPSGPRAQRSPGTINEPNPRPASPSGR